MDEEVWFVFFICGNEVYGVEFDMMNIFLGLLFLGCFGLVIKCLVFLVSYVVEVVFEIDWEFYDLFGSMSVVFDYINLFFGVIVMIYECDVDMQLCIFYMQFYDNFNDFWGMNINSYFQDLWFYWVNNNVGVDCMFVYQLCGCCDGFGVVYVGVFCLNSFGFGLMMSICGNYNLLQIVLVWDFVVVVYEFGYNFVFCYIYCYSLLIDQCLMLGMNCYSGLIFVLSDGGMIMSYCYLCSGGMSNINIWFGCQGFYGNQFECVNQVMLNYFVGVQLSGCLLVVFEILLIFGDGFEVGLMLVWFIDF